MNRWLSFPVVMVLALAVDSVITAAEKEKPRNSFNVKDVPDPDGEDVKAFAATVKLAGAAKDPNAEQWVPKATPGKVGSLDGEWSSRWNGGSAGNDWEAGTATVKTVGERVYILYKDRGGSYLIEAKRQGKTRLVGRYITLREDNDSSPWVGEIVDGERIDGEWTMGRWDLRRKLADK